MCEYCNAIYYVEVQQLAKPLLAPLTHTEKIRQELINITGINYLRIKANYCPMCRKEAGRVKHITLKEMLEEIIQCIVEQKEIKDYYWKDGEGEFRRITEIDLLDRIRTSNDDFTEFEWELAESRLYKVE